MGFSAYLTLRRKNIGCVIMSIGIQGVSGEWLMLMETFWKLSWEGMSGAWGYFILVESGKSKL